VPPRIRQCVECAWCRTRYLIGFSPYANGSYLLPSNRRDVEEYRLHCSCGKAPARLVWSDPRAYAVSSSAHARGFGAPDEVVAIERSPATLNRRHRKLENE
jgi:hypothetical protein